MRLDPRIPALVWLALTGSFSCRALASDAAAPSPPPVPAPATATAKPLKLGGLLITGSVRTRLESWNWFEGAADGAYGFSGTIARLSLAQSRSRFDWQFELAAPLLLGLPADAAAPAPQLQSGAGASYFAANGNRRNGGSVFAKQGFIRFKSLFGDERQTFRMGRFEWSDGSEATPKDATLAALKRDRIVQRLIGPFAWTHTGRSFDGIHYSASCGRLVYTLLAAIPTRGVFQTGGWGNLHTGFGYGSITGQTGGGRSAGEWRALAIAYQDWRRVLKADNRLRALRNGDLENIRIGTYGGHYLHKLDTAAGTWNVLLWAVAQNGNWGRLDHLAAAADFEAGYQPAVLPALRPWLSFGLSHSSGDSNPADGRHGSFFQLLPTPRPFARFPFFNMMNNQDRFAMLTLRPSRSATVRSEFHALRLANPRDLWYSGGGAFQPATFGYTGRSTAGARGFANLWDSSADWNPGPHWNLQLYCGYAAAKAAIRAVYPQGASGQFGYLEVTYRF